jgi:hypothetical protein
MATLQTTAWLVATLIQRHGLAFKRLSTAETRAAYYNPPGQRPTGINDHAACTLAFPEDSGDHMDVGPEFPWDIFFDLVKQNLSPEEDDMPKYMIEIQDNGVERVVCTNGVSWWWVRDASQCLGFFGQPFPSKKVTTAQLNAGFGANIQATSASGGATAQEVQEIVDTELDEAFSGGADND